MATWTVCTPLQTRCYDNESDAQYYASRLYHDAGEKDVWITEKSNEEKAKMIWASTPSRWHYYFADKEVVS
jgi:uncharacterized cupin superfamily protein